MLRPIVPEFCGRVFSDENLDPFVLHRESNEVLKFVGDNVSRRVGATKEAAIMSLGRCGSTLMGCLLIGMGTGFRWGDGAYYQHGYIGRSDKVRFGMYRDARDVVCSLALAQYGYSEDLEARERSLVKSYENMFGGGRRQHVFLRLLREPDVVLIRYEKYLPHSVSSLIEDVAQHLSLKMTADYQEYLAWEFGIDRAAKRASHLASFLEVDKLTRLHGRHVNTGSSGIWETVFTPRICELVKPGIGDFLVAYGYEENVDWSV
jgi:hypothetical protein